MSWHYQLRKRSNKGGDFYDIVEVFDDPTGWTKDSIVPISDTPEEMVETLQCMIEDILIYPTLVDKEED